MVVISRSGRSGVIHLPKYRAIFSFKITVTDNGEVTDVTDKFISMTRTRNIGRIATCEVTLANPVGLYLNKWNGGEVVDIYGEYADTLTPSTKMFSGKIDYPSFRYSQDDGYTCTLICRQTPEMADIKIVEQFDNALATDAIKQIINNNYSTIITYNNLEDNTTRITADYRHVSGIQAISDICSKANMDCYIDFDADLHAFTKESVINTDEDINLENNIIDFGDYMSDTTKIANKITIYGKEEDGNIILLKTEEDTTSQADLWQKDLIITDNSLTTMAAIQDRADKELTNNTAPIATTKVGNITTIGLIDINPGEMVNVSMPYCGANGYHKLASITDSLSSSGFTSNIAIQDDSLNLTILFKERIDSEENLKPYSNLNAMENSYTIYFDEDPTLVTHTNTVISDNILQLQSGENTGTTLFATKSTDSNIAQAELRIVTNYPQDQLCSYDISNDDGATWESITPGVVHVFSSTGSRLKFRINLVGDATTRPAFDKICILYKK